MVFIDWKLGLEPKMISSATAIHAYCTQYLLTTKKTQEITFYAKSIDLLVHPVTLFISFYYHTSLKDIQR